MPLAGLILLFGFLFPVSDVSAHSSRLSAGPISGIAIPSLSHGEMAVLDAYHGKVNEVADRVRRTDPQFRRLQNYAAIQYSYCFWGIAPGAMTDEQSPFNECAHAYLAATKALLLYMRAMPDADPAASELVSKIDLEMIRTGAAFIGCQYSGASFNTAEFITPHWENISAHMPTMVAAGGMLSLFISALFLGIVRRVSTAERAGTQPALEF